MGLFIIPSNWSDSSQASVLLTSEFPWNKNRSPTQNLRMSALCTVWFSMMLSIKRGFLDKVATLTCVYKNKLWNIVRNYEGKGRADPFPRSMTSLALGCWLGFQNQAWFDFPLAKRALSLIREPLATTHKCVSLIACLVMAVTAVVHMCFSWEDS